MINEKLNSVFGRVMGMEGKSISTLYSGEEFRCFFRRQNDGTQSTDYMIMYYPVDSPVEVGTLLLYRNKTFLVLNKETTENDVYYKSAIVRTNGNLTTNTLSVMDLPFYGETLSNGDVANENYFYLLDGKLEVKTEDCEKSRALVVGDKLNEWGRTFQIDNIYYADGIAYIILAVVEDETVTLTYTVQLSTLAYTSVTPGMTDTLSATCYINDVVTDGTITYESSDETIATIDSDGNIEYIGLGDVTFTAYWAEHDVESTTETVTCEEESTDTYALYVEELPEIYNGFAENIDYSVTKNGESVTDIPITFTAECTAGDSYNKYITITDYGTYIELLVDGSSMSNKTVVLTAQNEEYGLYATQNIKVLSFF